MTSATEKSSIQTVVERLEAKKVAVGWEGLSKDERMILNQACILAEYTNWLQSPLAQQSSLFVKGVVKSAAESHSKCVQTMCERHEQGVSNLST